MNECTAIFQVWLLPMCREYRLRIAATRTRTSVDCTMNALRMLKTWLHRARDGAAFNKTTLALSAPPILVKLHAIN